MISLINIKKSINDANVLNDISLDISSGDFYVICCQNGGGKTTLIKLISKITKEDEGKIIYDGITKNDIGIVYDVYESNTLLTTFEYLTFYGMCNGVEEIEVNKRIEYYLSKYNKNNIKYMPFDDLSRSDKKLVSMIGILISDCKLIIFDEPYKHIFEDDRHIVTEILKETKDNRTVIATCENLDRYVDIANKIAILDKGSITINGDVKDVLVQYGYKNYLEVYYDGDIEEVAPLLKKMDNIKEYTYSDKKIDIVTYQYGKDYEILKVLIDNGININSFKREEKK